MGYVSFPGGKIGTKKRAIALEEFKDMNYHTGRRNNGEAIYVDTTDIIHMNPYKENEGVDDFTVKGCSKFPLVKAYIKAFRTIEGIEAGEELKYSDFVNVMTCDYSTMDIEPPEELACSRVVPEPRMAQSAAPVPAPATKTPPLCTEPPTTQ